MSLELRILISPSDRYAHEMLEVFLSTPLIELIQKVEEELGVPVRANFNTYLSRNNNREPHYGVTTTSPYGEVLKTVKVKNLTSVIDYLIADKTYGNQGTGLFLQNLNPEVYITFYWY